MEQAILQFFEGLRCPPLDIIFSFFSFFGEATVLAAAVVLLYWLIANDAGEQILLTALTSLPLTVLLKHAVVRPRPYAAGVVARAEVDNFFTSTEGLGDNLSFPSGHAQSAGSVLCALSLRLKGVWVWIFSAALVILIICSRLYLGVHYPTDVLAGLVFGVAVALFWNIIYRRAYRFRYIVLCGIALATLVPVLFFVHEDYIQAAGFLAGSAFFLPLYGIIFKRKPAPFPRRLWRIPVGLLTMGVVFTFTLLLPEGFALLKWFLLAGAATFLSELCFGILKI